MPAMLEYNKTKQRRSLQKVSRKESENCCNFGRSFYWNDKNNIQPDSFVCCFCCSYVLDSVL